MSRTKGAVYEREVVNELNDLMWVDYATRNLSQSRDGGWDVTTPLFGIECKRCEKLEHSKWIKQGQKSVEGTDKRWAVAYRQSRKTTRVIVEMSLEEFTAYEGSIPVNDTLRPESASGVSGLIEIEEYEHDSGIC